MNVSQTSLDAFMQLQRDNRVNANQTIILDVFRKMVREHPLSDFEIAKILNWSINRVTPRRGELAKMGLLVLVGHKRQLETGHRVQLWGLPEDNLSWIDFDYTKTRMEE